MGLSESKPQPVNRVASHLSRVGQGTGAVEPDRAEVIARAIKYLASIPPGIQGQGGSAATLFAARAVVRGFALGPDSGFELLRDHFNPRCVPEWSEAELRRKCDDAANREFNKPNGWLIAESKAKPRLASPAVPVPAPATRPSSPATSEPAPSGPPSSSPSAPSPAASTPAGSSPPAKRGPYFIYNYTLHTTEGSERPEKVGMPPQTIAADVLAATGGWPKRLDGERPKLFMVNTNHTVRWIDKPTALHAWMAEETAKTGGAVYWGKGESLRSKEEFYDHLLGSQAVDSFEDVQHYPHFNPIPGIYYAHPPIPDSGNGALDELLDCFLPSTETDKYLIKALFATLAWGGKLGGRPLFCIESADTEKAGQGSGKTTLATIAGDLVGGYTMMQLTGGIGHEENIEKRLFSRTGRKKRVVIFDNVKGSRISSALFEAFISAPVISGRANYDGEGTRPNHITWIVTANDPSLGKDLTKRVLPIRITPPEYSPHWFENVSRIVSTRRWEILADIRDLLAGSFQGDIEGDWTRWSDWEKDVLGRITDPVPTMEVVRQRQAEMDDDEGVVEIVRGIIAAGVYSRHSGNPEQIWTKIDAEALADMVKKECPYLSKTTNSVLMWLSRIRVPGLSKHRSYKGRSWVWKGNNCHPEIENPIEWDRIPS